MSSKRLPLVLFIAVALVAFLGYHFLFSEGGERSERDGTRARAPSAGSRAESGVDGAGSESGSDIADAALLKELIAKYGGFRTTLTAVLTRPQGPGAGLDVRMRGQVAGAIVQVDGQTDASGMIELPAVPRAGEYELTIEGARVQTVTVDGIRLPEGDLLEMGEIELARWYVLKGHVYGNSRTGVEGATVALLGNAFESGGFSFYRLLSEAGQADPVLAQTTTGPNGSFEVKLANPGSFTVRARAKGWAPHTKGDVIVGGVADTQIDLGLSEGATVIGVVLDATGRPLAETPVMLTPGGRRAWTGGYFKEVETTDGGGRFEFHVEPGRYNATVVVAKKLNLSEEFDVPLTEDLVLQMPGAGVLTGRVLDEATQQPIPGADIMLGLNKAGTRGGMRADHSKALKSDAYGRFRVEGIGPGKIQSLTVRAKGYSDVRLMAWMGTHPDLWKELSGMQLSGEGEEELPALLMSTGRALTGVIRDAKSNDPIEGARVEIQDFIMGPRDTVTGPDGMYRFSGVGARAAMTVSADGYAPFRESPFPGFQLPGEGEAIRDLELEPGGIVKGTVKTADGEPVARALVRLRPVATGWRAMGVAMSLREAWTHTNEKGEYEMRGVAIAKVYAEAQAPGYDPSKSKEADVKAGQVSAKVDVTLLPGATMDGIVVARDGTPVTAARLTIASDPGPNADAGSQWRMLATGSLAFSDSKGRFAVREVPLGDIVIRAEADGYATISIRRKNITPGQTLENVRVEMPPAFSIAGKVVDDNGKPYSRCWVRARHVASPDGQPMKQLLGDRVEGDGTFEIGNLPAGTYTLEVAVFNWGRTDTGPRYENLTVEGIGSGAKDLTLRLKPATTGG